MNEEPAVKGEDARPGLSRRARRAIITMLAIAAVVVPLSAWLGPRVNAEAPPARGPLVGGDLHAVAMLAGRTFVSGHSGAAYLADGAPWRSIPTLDDRDVMAWAATPNALLGAGHRGLYVSRDDGRSFSEARARLASSDVHALGAAQNLVYLASPEAGLLISDDGGDTFRARSDVGSGFMGSIAVDPADPRRAIAADMQLGSLLTTDGGATWERLRDHGTGDALSAAWNPRNPRQVVVLGAQGAARSSDAGESWSRVSVPATSRAIAFDDNGVLNVVALVGGRATVLRSEPGGWRSVR